MAADSKKHNITNKQDFIFPLLLNRREHWTSTGKDQCSVNSKYGFFKIAGLYTTEEGKSSVEAHRKN